MLLVRDVLCIYCLRLTKKGGGYTRDHIIAKSLGGKDKGNIAHCCFDCNQIKSNKTLEEFLSFVQGCIDNNEMPRDGYNKCILGVIRKRIKAIILEKACGGKQYISNKLKKNKKNERSKSSKC